jgi:hypothetical protein
MKKLPPPTMLTKLCGILLRRSWGKNARRIKISKTAEINPSIFNNYFLNIADNITHNISTSAISDTDTNNDYKHYLNLTVKGPFPKIIFNNITGKEIEKVISSLPSKSSSGYDEFSMKTLKISAPYISSPSCYIFNKAVLVGKFPSCMKYSTVTLIYIYIYIRKVIRQIVLIIDQFHC